MADLPLLAPTSEKNLPLVVPAPTPVPTTTPPFYTATGKVMLCEAMLRNGICEQEHKGCQYRHDKDWLSQLRNDPELKFSEIDTSKPNLHGFAEIIGRGYITFTNRASGRPIRFILPNNFVFFTKNLERLLSGESISLCDIHWRHGKCPKNKDCSFLHVSNEWPGKKPGLLHPLNHSILCPSVADTGDLNIKTCSGFKYACPYAHNEDELRPYEEVTRVTTGKPFKFQVDNKSKPQDIDPSSPDAPPIYYTNLIVNLHEHEAVGKVPVLCKHFARSSCIRDSDCNFLHAVVPGVNKVVIKTPPASSSSTPLASSSLTASVVSAMPQSVLMAPIATAPLQSQGMPPSFLPDMPPSFLRKDFPVASSVEKEMHQDTTTVVTSDNSEVQQLKRKNLELEATLIAERTVNEMLRSKNTQLKTMHDFLAGQVEAYKRMLPPPAAMPQHPMLFSSPSNPTGTARVGLPQPATMPQHPMLFSSPLNPTSTVRVGLPPPATMPQPPMLFSSPLNPTGAVRTGLQFTQGNHPQKFSFRPAV